MWLMVLGCTSHPSEWWGRYPWFARGLPDWCLVELLGEGWLSAGGGWLRAVLLGGLVAWTRARQSDPLPARGPVAATALLVFVAE